MRPITKCILLMIGSRENRLVPRHTQVFPQLPNMAESLGLNLSFPSMNPIRYFVLLNNSFARNAPRSAHALHFWDTARHMWRGLDQAQQVPYWRKMFWDWGGSEDSKEATDSA